MGLREESIRSVRCWSNGDADFACVELSLTVPITNSLAFLFTVLGEWWAEGKVISRGKCNGHLAQMQVKAC